MLVDTDVFIWFLRGNTKAARALELLDSISISAVTYIELVQGMRNNKELRVLRSCIKDLNIEILPINELISMRASFYIEEYFLSHNIRLADALIAATAVLNGKDLLTGNAKHYKMIKDLGIKKFRSS